MSALPEPTRPEAFALVVGIPLFWSLGFGAAVLGQADPVVAGVFFGGAFIVFGWVWVAGVWHVQRRAERQADDADVVLSPRPFGFGNPTLRWRICSPSYCKRATNVLGWKPSAVFAALAILLISEAVAGLVLAANH